MIPLTRIDWASSSRGPWSIWTRGWRGFGTMRSRSTSSGTPRGAAGAAGRGAGGASAGASGIRALRPRPSAGRFSATQTSSHQQDIANRSSDSGGHRDGRASRLEDLARQAHVGLGALRLHVVEQHRQSMTRGFAQTNIAWDDAREHFFGEERADVAWRPVDRGWSGRRTSSAGRRGCRASGSSDARTRRMVATRSAMPSSAKYSQWRGTITASAATSAFSVSRPKRRRRVDEDVVVLVPNAGQALREPCFACFHRDQLDLGAGQVTIGGHELHLVDSRRQLGQRRRPHQRLVDRRALGRLRLQPTPLVRLP